MQEPQRADEVVVSGANGPLGVVRAGAIDRPHVNVRLNDGRRLTVPADLLERQADGSLRLPSQVIEQLDAVRGESVRIPVVEERIVVDKREHETGQVVVRVTATQHEEQLDVPLARETVEVQRVRKDEFVAERPEVRQEGDELIVPLVEEVLVVERRLMLREEVRIRRRRDVHRETHHVTLRAQDVEIARNDADR